MASRLLKVFNENANRVSYKPSNDIVEVEVQRMLDKHQINQIAAIARQQALQVELWVIEETTSMVLRLDTRMLPLLKAAGMGGNLDLEVAAIRATDYINATSRAHKRALGE